MRAASVTHATAATPSTTVALTEAPATSRTSIATDIASTDTPTRANQSVIVGTRLRAQVEPWRRPTAVTSTAGDDPAGRQAQQTPGEPGVPSGHLATAPLLSSSSATWRAQLPMSSQSR